MAKTNFVRVAVSGPTIDGRNIDAAQLQQMAKNYKTDTYAARVNLEHFRGVTGGAPFQMYGDVLALKTEDVTLDIAGKSEKRTGLFAQMDVSDDLVALNKSGQKLYTSIEIMPNFAETNEAYLYGLAVTDSPASLGTQRLQFTTNAKAMGNLVSQPDLLDLKLDDAAANTAVQTEAAAAFTAVKDFFAGFAGLKPAAPAVITAPAAVPAVPAEMAAFATQILGGLQVMTTAIEASHTAMAASHAAVEKVAADLAQFKADVEATPNNNYTVRPVATGGDGTILADC